MEAITHGLNLELFRGKMFDVGGSPISLLTLAVSLLVIAATIAVAWLLRRAIRRGLALRGVGESLGVRASLRALHYLLLLLGFGIALSTADSRNRYRSLEELQQPTLR